MSPQADPLVCAAELRNTTAKRAVLAPTGRGAPLAAPGPQAAMTPSPHTAKRALAAPAAAPPARADPGTAVLLSLPRKGRDSEQPTARAPDPGSRPPLPRDGGRVRLRAAARTPATRPSRPISARPAAPRGADARGAGADPRPGLPGAADLGPHRADPLRDRPPGLRTGRPRGPRRGLHRAHAPGPAGQGRQGSPDAHDPRPGPSSSWCTSTAGPAAPSSSPTGPSPTRCG